MDSAGIRSEYYHIQSTCRYDISYRSKAVPAPNCHSTKASRGSRRRAPRTLVLATVWRKVVNFVFLSLYPRNPMFRSVGGSQSRSRYKGENDSGKHSPAAQYVTINSEYTFRFLFTYTYPNTHKPYNKIHCNTVRSFGCVLWCVFDTCLSTGNYCLFYRCL
jgi:hypothetical protein